MLLHSALEIPPSQHFLKYFGDEERLGLGRTSTGPSYVSL
jgi:hypothetical protein